MDSEAPQKTTAYEPVTAQEFMPKGRPEGLWRVAIQRLFRQRSGIVGMIIMGSLVLIALFAPVIAPYPPNEVLIGKEEGVKRSRRVRTFGSKGQRVKRSNVERKVKTKDQRRRRGL